MPLRSQDHTLAGRVAVRVKAADGSVVGAGFLIGPGRVATCAHVVASAAGADPYAPEPPGGPVELDFPLLGDTARGVVRRWQPIAEDGTGDIAVLELLGPPPAGARMPPLRRVDQLWDQRFRVLGFPGGMADGVWTTGRLRGAQGTRWFQLQTDVGDQPVVEGFSGAPVWHEETGAVVGMTVAADNSGTTTTAYLIPVEQVLGTDPELLPCPYRGLEPFHEEHADYFFGRDTDVTALAEVLAAHPLVAVTGPSGVGKSSLVGAGLVPRLRAGGARIARMTPLPGQPVERGLTAALATAPGADGGPVVLVVDQFEELAAARPDEARRLLERIGELVTAPEPIRAVLTVRSATLDDVLVPELAGLLSAGTVLVPPMQRNQLRDAIVAPAERAPGLSFEAGLVDRILDDAAAEPGQLPLVESVLTELWTRRDGGQLTVRAYEEAGGVAGVIATHAEAVLAGFTEAGDLPRLRRLLTALAGPDREGRFVRTSLAWADVPPDLRPVVHRLAAGRLVVLSRTATGAEHVQLAHQALIAHWPRLRDWLTEDRAFIAWRTQLDEQRKRWEDADRDDGALLRGTPLSTALDWLPARAADVPEVDRDYVRRSRARQRREVRRWRVVTAVLAVLVLAAGTLSVIAVTRGNRINDQLRLANAELVAQAALARAGFDPVAATQLALTAWHLDPGNGSARTALLNQYLAMRSVTSIASDVGGSGLDSIVAARGADRVMVRNGAGLTVFDGLAAGRPRRWDVPVPDGYRTAGFVDDGRTLVVLGLDGTVLRWDLTDRAGPEATATGITAPETTRVWLSPDATRVAWMLPVGPGVQALELRDGTGAVVEHRVAPVEEANGVGITLPADPDLVVLHLADEAAAPGPLVVRSLADGAVRASFPPGSVPTGDPAGTVLSCEQDGDSSVAVLRTMAEGAELRRFPLLGLCSAQRPLLVTAGDDNLIEVTPPAGEADSRTARVTRVADGSTFGLALPPDSRNALNPQFGIPLALVDHDGATTALLAQGSSLLRLDARPVPADRAVTLWPTDDDRYTVAFDGSGTVVLDGGMRPVAALSHAQARTNTDATVDLTSGVTLLSPLPDGWNVTHLALPTLEPRVLHAVPADPGPGVPHVVVAEDRVVVVAGHVATAWSRTTGEQLYEPTVLPDSYRTNPGFDVRPGRPDEVVLERNAGAGVGGEVWDLRQRRRVGEIPLDGTHQPIDIRYSPSGQQLVSHSLGAVLEVRDATTLDLVRPPFPVPGTTGLFGATADGYAVTWRTAEVNHVELWDVARGSQSGTFALPPLYRLNGLGRDGRALRVGAAGGGLPFNLPVTGPELAARLCPLVDQPFPDDVRALLPDGVDAERPCAAG